MSKRLGKEIESRLPNLFGALTFSAWFPKQPTSYFFSFIWDFKLSLPNRN